MSIGCKKIRFGRVILALVAVVVEALIIKGKTKKGELKSGCPIVSACLLFRAAERQICGVASTPAYAAAQELSKKKN